MQIGNKIDAVVYGNPVTYQAEVLSKIYFLDTIYEPLQQRDPPVNSSKETKNELTSVAALLRKTLSDKDMLDRYLSVHFHFTEFWKQSLVRSGVYFDFEIINGIDNDVDNICTKLKFYFNRPRPYQLAAYYKLSLFPETTYGIESPAYPSSFYLKSLMYSHLLSNSGNFSVFETMTETVRKSRLALGFNYPSDMEYSKIVYQHIIKNKGFINKYGLDNL